MGTGPRTALALILFTLIARESLAFRLMGCTEYDSCDLTCSRRWLNSSVGYHINPNFPDTELSGSPQAQVEFLRCAADAWRAQSRADFEFIYEGTTNQSGLNLEDGINVISWANAHGGDALAITLVKPGPLNNSASAFDIVFFATIGDREDPIPVYWSGPGEPYWSGPGEPSPNSQYDLRGVAVHEFGHALGLHHSEEGSATMFSAAISKALPLRTLEADDRQGLECLYGTRTEEEPVVEILSISPATGPTVGGTEVFLTGSNFSYTSDTQLLIDGVALSSEFWEVEGCSTLRIHAMPPHPSGSVSIHLDSEIGSVTLESAYVYTGPQPEILSITPSEGFNAGGAEVEVHGENFVEGAIITIAGNALFEQTVVDGSTITGVVPETATQGPVDVKVEQGEDESVLPGGFTYKESPPFTRGNANGDQEIDLSDAIHHLSTLFQGGPQGPCLDAADANDDGILDISDPIFLLGYLFQGRDIPPEPYPEPGLDPTPDSLGCDG